MTYDERKQLVELGEKIAQAITRAISIERAKEGLTRAGVPQEFWQ